MSLRLRLLDLDNSSLSGLISFCTVWGKRILGDHVLELLKQTLNQLQMPREQSTNGKRMMVGERFEFVGKRSFQTGLAPLLSINFSSSNATALHISRDISHEPLFARL